MQSPWGGSKIVPPDSQNKRNRCPQRAHTTHATHTMHTRNSSTGKRDILLRTGIYLTPALSFRRRRRPVISGWIGFGIGFGKPPFIVVPAAVAKNHPRHRVPQLLAAPKTCRGGFSFFERRLRHDEGRAPETFFVWCAFCFGAMRFQRIFDQK